MCATWEECGRPVSTSTSAQRPLGADMQNYIHAFQVSTTSTCIFNDSSAAFITFYRRYLQKKSVHPQPVLVKWDIAVGEAAFYEVRRLTRFHKRGPFDMTHVID
ncbi:hypothetical protein CAPTEDRAFT_187900 [Capitella teleta]|uniref:Uncharacterized protein n=1 Tax=Capitella teleta TaxID=283909 RepID=R7VC29_CAPTE|nr:hypothetical protein CAPTEDRAFT_187900 [Capitella teleta]|eukprot:ELU13225.1 hypothetical protein CAPTEDRAFT_187900 [Capitella teleta]